jgi:hypothetical protein
VNLFYLVQRRTRERSRRCAARLRGAAVFSTRRAQHSSLRVSR